MSNVFGGVEGAPSGDQINLTFQKMAGKIHLERHLINVVNTAYIFADHLTLVS